MFKIVILLVVVTLAATHVCWGGVIAQANEQQSWNQNHYSSTLSAPADVSLERTNASKGHDSAPIDLPKAAGELPPVDGTLRSSEPVVVYTGEPTTAASGYKTMLDSQPLAAEPESRAQVFWKTFSEYLPEIGAVALFVAVVFYIHRQKKLRSAATSS